MPDFDDSDFEPDAPAAAAPSEGFDDSDFEPLPGTVQPEPSSVVDGQTSVSESENAKSETNSEEPGLLSKVGSALWDYNPARAGYELAREKLTGTAPESELGKAISGSGDTAQAAAQGVLKGAALGTNTLQDYVHAAGDQVADVFDGDRSNTFDESLDMARANRKGVAEANPIAAGAGEVVGALGAGIATGGASGVAAKALPQAAAALTKFAGKGLLRRASVAAGVLLAEGAVEGNLYKAAQEVDQAAERGDFKGVGERLAAGLGNTTFEGAKSNLLWGGGLRLGVIGLQKVGSKIGKMLRGGLPEVIDTPENAKEALGHIVADADARAAALDGEIGNLGKQADAADVAGDADAAARIRQQAADLQTQQAQIRGAADEAADRAASGKPVSVQELAVRTTNKAQPPEPDTIEAALHDPARPLRARDLDDAGDDVARLARSQIDPETAAQVRLAALETIESKGQRMLELEAGIDHKLRLATKQQWIKDMPQEWKGPSFDEFLNQAGLTDGMLADLEKRTQGEGASAVARLRDKIAMIRSELPQPRAARPSQFRAPLPGQRLQTATPQLGDNPYQNIEDLGNLRASLEKAAKGAPEVPARPMTLGDMAYALDGVKRQAQKLAASRGGLIHERLLNPTEALKLSLEDATTFGDFGARQAPVNTAWSYDIDTSNSPLLKGMIKEGNVKADRFGGDPYEVADVLDRKAIASHLENVGMPKGTEDQVEEAFKRRLRARELSYTERMSWTKDDAELAKMVEERSQLRKSIEDEVNRVALANRAVSAPKAGPSVTEDVVSSIPIAGPLAKRTAARAAAWQQTKVQDAAGAAFGLKAQAAKTQERLNNAVRRTLPKNFDQTVERVERATRRVMTQQQIQKVIDAADKFGAPDGDEEGKLGASLQRLEETVGPEVAQAYAQQLEQRAAFLREKAGPAPTGSVFAGKAKREFDGESLERLSRYIDASDDPIAALERIGRGEAASEDYETLEALSPSMLEDYKSKVVAQLAESKSEIPYETQVALSQALRIPLTAEEQPEAQAFWQTFMKTAEQNAPPPASRAPKLGKDAQSKADRLG